MKGCTRRCLFFQRVFIGEVFRSGITLKELENAGWKHAGRVAMKL